MAVPSTPALSAEKVALPRELANFLIELAIALQSHGVYPAGHPFLVRSADAVMRRLDGLFLDRDSVSFGVARQQLVIEGVATDPNNPVLSGLAGRLHRHRVGAVTMGRGARAEEVSAFLALLSSEAEVSGPALPAQGEAPSWGSIRLHPLSYAQLELSGEAEAGASEDPRAARLWIGLARAAVESDEEEEASPEPAAVAEAINREAHAVAYDQVIVGYLLQLADELRHGDERGAPEVRRRLSQMIAGLHPDALRRLVEMGGDDAQRRRFLLNASHGFAAEAVVKLVEAAAGASEQTISHSLLRLLSKLAAHAERSGGPVRMVAERELREQVQLLVGGWTLPDPNPEAYSETLDRLSRSATGTAVLPGPNDPAPLRMVQTALEVDTAGTTAWAALSRMMAEGELPALLSLLDTAPEGSHFAAAAWDFVSTPESVRALLAAGPEGSAALDRLVERMGAGAIAPLLDEMAASELRVVRRAALDRLGRMGAPAAAEAVRRLDDERWFVIRNLLVILQDAGSWPAGFSPAPFLRHDDARVRREAFKLAFRVPDERARALSLALVDADDQVNRSALAECGSDCPPAVLPLVCRRADDAATDPELRVLAIRVLGGAREPAAVQTLLRLVDGGRGWLRKPRLAPPSPHMHAALAALATGWAEHPAAATFLEIALRSTDPEVIRAALTRGEPR
jgi:HEAT repeat protein